MANEDVPNTDLQGTLMEHSKQLGAAIERLDALGSAQEAFQTGLAGISDLGGRIENVAQRQEEIAGRLAKLEALPAVKEEAEAVGENLDPNAPAHVDKPDEVPNDTGDNRPSILRKIHNAVG